MVRRRERYPTRLPQSGHLNCLRFRTQYSRSVSASRNSHPTISFDTGILTQVLGKAYS